MIVDWENGADYLVVAAPDGRKFCVGCSLSNGVTHPMSKPTELTSHLNAHAAAGHDIEPLRVRATAETDAATRAVTDAETKAAEALAAVERARSSV